MNFKNASIGHVPNHWHVTELKDYLNRITYGFTNPMPDSNEGPWKITAKDVINGRINYSTARKTTKNAFENDLTDKSRPNIGDILLTKDGSIGRVAVVDRDDICINQSVALLQPNEMMAPHFLKYLLMTPFYQKVMTNDASGSTIKHIYITRVDKMEIAVPELKEQLRIVDHLLTLDQKIHLNQQTNETLEAMAQAIFKSWFVDFDPVRAKIEAKSAGRDPNRAAMAAIAGISLEQPSSTEASEGRDWGEIEAALNQKLARMSEAQQQQLSRTAQLFPDELVDSEVGFVPKGWEIESVFNQAEYINGAAFRGSDFSKSRNGLPVIKIAELKSGVTDQTKFTEKEVDKKYHIDSGDVLFSWSGNPDTSIDIFIWEGGHGLLNQHIFKIESDSKTRKVFNYYFLKSMLPFFKRTAANKQTTGLGHVTQRDLKRKQVSVPSTELINEFSKQAEPIFDKIFNNLMETENLSSLRNTLLPKLISGEIQC